MKPFEMQMPASVEEAVALLPTEEGDESAKLLAGGQDLLTEMKEHLVEPERLVNLKSIPGLDAIEWDDAGRVTIGALVTLERLARDERLRSKLTLLAEAAESVGSPQIRAVGTLGGNLNQRPRCWYYRSEHALCLKKGGSECFSYAGLNRYNAILGGGPSYIVHPSDIAPALEALSAEMVLVGPGTKRRVAAAEYFTLPEEGNILRETVLRPNEILTQVVIPPPRPGMRSTYLKFKERGSYDFALSAVALCLWKQGEQVLRARIVLGGVAPKPWRRLRAEQVLAGNKIELEICKATAATALGEATPLSQNAYKVALTQGLIVRALQKFA